MGDGADETEAQEGEGAEACASAGNGDPPGT
jgi:hypothetical protein